MDLVAQPASYSALAKVRRPQLLRKHEQWPEIHSDVATSTLTPIEICRKYDLRGPSGSFAIQTVSRYRADLFEQYKDLFARAGELEQEMLRNEVLGKFRHVYDCASEGHDLAKSEKGVVGKGKNAEVVQRPNFSAMREQQDSMLAAAEKLALVVPTSRTAAPVQQHGAGTTINILALPKSEGVPQRGPAPVHVITSKSA